MTLLRVKTNGLSSGTAPIQLPSPRGDARYSDLPDRGEHREIVPSGLSEHPNIPASDIPDTISSIRRIIAELSMAVLIA